MTYTQPDLFNQSEPRKSFEEAALHGHNNRQSDLQCEKHYQAFAGYANELFDNLMNGARITQKNKHLYTEAIDIRSAIRIIRDAGFYVSDDEIPNSHKAKVWFMSGPDRLENLLLIEKRRRK